MVMMGSLATVASSLYGLYTLITDHENEKTRPEERTLAAGSALFTQALSGTMNLISGALALTSALQSGDEADASNRNSAILMATGEVLAMLGDTYGAYKRYEKDGLDSAGFILQASKLFTSLMKLVGCIMIASSENDEELGNSGTWIVFAFASLSMIFAGTKIGLIMQGKIQPLAEDPETGVVGRDARDEGADSSTYSDSEAPGESSLYSDSADERLPDV
jgi:hypothetical protein